MSGLLPFRDAWAQELVARNREQDAEIRRLRAQITQADRARDVAEESARRAWALFAKTSDRRPDRGH